MPRAVHVSGVCVVVSNSDSSHVARGELLMWHVLCEDPLTLLIFSYASLKLSFSSDWKVSSITAGTAAPAVR